MGDLGALSPVNVREVWAGESGDFTPWLAENADRLGEALGMDLIHEQTEAPVGRYSADLVFRDASTDRLIVVENMFGATDHDHLGKLITYAAGLGASYAVLLAPCRSEGSHRLRAEAYIDTRDAETTKAAFDGLHRRKEQMEKAVGEDLEWDRKDDKRGSRVSLYFPDEIRVTDEERWPDARAWLVEAMGKMRDAFNPALQELQP